MATIIAGHFQLQEEAEQASLALQRAGFDAARISVFYNNPPGQHAVIPTGGDRQTSPGAQESPAGLAKGAAAGAAAGAAVGAVTAPLTGPLGPVLGGLVGAHVGSLYTLSDMKERGEPEAGGRANEAAPREACMVVAVALDGPHAGRAAHALRQAGARQLERAEGHIEQGDWRDFDPLSLPQWV